VSLLDLLDHVIGAGNAAEDSLAQVVEAQIEGETALGRVLHLADKVKAHSKLVNKLEARRDDARKNGHPPSTIGSVLDVAEFLFRK
jgi:hypothetical protein